VTTCGSGDTDTAEGVGEIDCRPKLLIYLVENGLCNPVQRVCYKAGVLGKKDYQRRVL
jgi:hypothetical protein